MLMTMYYETARKIYREMNVLHTPIHPFRLQANSVLTFQTLTYTVHFPLVQQLGYPQLTLNLKYGASIHLIGLLDWSNGITGVCGGHCSMY